MKYLNCNSYVEVKDHRHRIHPTKNVILRLRDEPKSLRTHIRYKIVLRLEEIKKSSKLITISL